MRTPVDIQMGNQEITSTVTRQLRAWIPSAMLSYWVLIGGTAFGEIHPAIRFANVMVALILVVLWLRSASRHSDPVDVAILGATLLFLATCVTSTFPRQSLDAGITALGYASALTVGRRALAQKAARRRLLWTMAVLSATLALVTALRWLPALGTWFSVVGFQLPPLDLPFDARPWGHRHDLALLLVALSAAWAPLMGNYRARTFGIAVWTVIFVLVVIDGSRTMWLAIGATSVAVAVTKSFGRVSKLLRRHWILLSIAAMATVGVAGVSGALERVFNLQTLSARGELWGSALDAWRQRPLFGFGPGSFPWTLSATDYFDVNTWAPRHPDSAFFQALPEAGIAGVIAGSVLLVMLVPKLWRGDAAQWAVICVLVACIGANPTDFGFMIAVLIAWAALGLPPADELGDRSSSAKVVVRSRHVPAAVVFGLLAPLVVAMSATGIAETQYIAARQAVERGTPKEALDHLLMASRLDPGMALYQRALGIAAWLTTERPETAVAYLEAAVTGNRYDDLSWRTLASAQLALHRPADAWMSIATALQLQRSDRTNLLLGSQIARASGRQSHAQGLAAEALQAWPSLSLGGSWEQYLRGIGQVPQLVMAAAMQRWQSSETAPRASPFSPIVLTALAHEPELLSDAIAQSDEPEALVEAVAAVVSCGAVTADELLVGAAKQQLRNPLYWSLRYVVDQALGRPLGRDLDILQIMGGGPGTPEMQTSVFDENVAVGFSIDQWGYRRQSFPARALGGLIPNPIPLTLANC